MVIKKTFLSVISSHIISKLLNKLVLSVSVYNSILACSLPLSSKVELSTDYSCAIFFCIGVIM